MGFDDFKQLVDNMDSSQKSAYQALKVALVYGN